jgi:hypothetical protein
MLATTIAHTSETAARTPKSSYLSGKWLAASAPEAGWYRAWELAGGAFMARTQCERRTLTIRHSRVTRAYGAPPQFFRFMTATGSRDASSSYGKINGAIGNVRTIVTPQIVNNCRMENRSGANRVVTKITSSQNFNRAATKL